MSNFKCRNRPLTAAILVALSLGYGSIAVAGDSSAVTTPQAPAAATPAAQQDSTTTAQSTSPETTSNSTKAEREKEKEKEKERVKQLSAVVVNGYAGSQQRDIQLKRYSAQTQDSITASNIGQLPAADIADALTHVAGVQVARSAGQGTTVAIRGITQVKTTINGEEYFNAGGGQVTTGQASFEAVPSSLVKGIDVLKSSLASDVAGGISGIINLRTYRPFDFKKTWTFSGAVKAEEGDRTRKLNPTGNALVAYHNDRWGALLEASYSDQVLADRTPNVGNAGIRATEQQAGWDFNHDGVIGNSLDPTVFPRDYYFAWINQGFGNKTSHRKRLGLHSSFEFKFNDSLKLTADADYSNYKKNDIEENLGLQSNNATFALPGEATITPNGVLTQGSTLYGKLNQHSQYDINNSKAINTNLQLNYDAGGFFSGSLRWVHAHTFSTLTSANIDSLPNHDAMVTLPDGTTQFYNPNAVPGLVKANVDYTGKYPAYNIITDVSNPANWLAASSWGYGNHPDVGNNIYRGDGAFHFDDGIFDSLQFGARYEKTDYVYNDYKYESPVSPAGSCANPDGPGPANQYYYFRDGQITDGCTGFSEAKGYAFNALPAGYVTRLNNVDPVGLTGTNLAQGLPAINTDAMKNPIAFLNSLSPGEKKFQAPSGSYRVTETIKSAYAQLNLNGELGFINDTPWSGNIGYRVVKTAIQITSFKTDASQYYGNGGSYNGVFINQGTLSTNNNYTTYLPAVNLAFDVTPDQQLRLAFNEGEARQNLADLGQGFQESFYANGNPPRYPDQPADLQIFNGASRGNPNLKPYRSKTYNASYAWYFTPKSIAYLGTFLYQIGSFPQYTTVHADLPDNDGVVRAGGPLSTFVNGGRAQVRGLEGEFRTQFTYLPGILQDFGTNLNYTYVKTGKTGLAHNSYNAVLFFDHAGWRARVAYNWRGKSYVQGNSSLGQELDIFSKPIGKLEASVTYDVNKHVSVFLQGSNLTDTFDNRYASYPNAFYYQNISERRYDLGARVKF